MSVLRKRLDKDLLGTGGREGNAQRNKLFTLCLFCNIPRNNYEPDNNGIKSSHKSELKFAPKAKI